MNRKDFFKVACFQGSCACLGLHTRDTSEPEPDWRIAFMQKRMARLVGAMGEKMDPATRKQVLEEMGRECARGYAELAEKFKGDIKGYLAEIQKDWFEKATYDETTGEIRIVDKLKNACACPFVDKSLMSDLFCNCTIGWQKQNYETVLGKPVDVVLESSVLRGDPQCVYRIQVKS